MAATEPSAEQSTPKPDTGNAQTSKPETADVQERPELAPNIELSGEMQDGAYESQQWLLQRNGSFIQVTELLYRVTEQIDGERDLDGIARGVSEATNRTVSADNVRTLIANKLIPMGVVKKVDGSVEGGQTDGQGGGRSALAVNMRMKMIGPEKINPVTKVLQVLFSPLILLLLLTAAAAADLWLFFIHGTAGGMRDAIQKPGLILAVLGCIIIATAWHEFGHAAALRYSGGKVRGMGAGIYLVYPAFYTDVTDAYRLGRWGKVRTDLGGFFFNLLFGMVMMGLYFLTRQEFLLLVALLVNLEIIHQMLPFVRLDGYWALADLTGIPDFFSQIKPFLRTYLPFPGWKGPKLPPMKTWVKVVFGLYILITIPLLLLVLFLTLTSVPRVLATAWDSFNKQLGAFSKAQEGGEFLGMAAAVIQICTLALPTFGMLMVLFKLGKKLVTTVWRWSRPTWPRRMAGSLGTLAAAALLVYLWAPQLPWSGQPGPLAAYARAHFVPIGPNERGTVLDGFNDLPEVVQAREPKVENGAPFAPAGFNADNPSVTAPGGAGQPTGVPTSVPGGVDGTAQPGPGGNVPTTVPGTDGAQPTGGPGEVAPQPTSGSDGAPAVSTPTPGTDGVTEPTPNPATDEPTTEPATDGDEPTATPESPDGEPAPTSVTGTEEESTPDTDAPEATQAPRETTQEESTPRPVTVGEPTEAPQDSGVESPAPPTDLESAPTEGTTP